MKDDSGSDALNRLEGREGLSSSHVPWQLPSVLTLQPSCLCTMDVENPDLRTRDVSPFWSPALQPLDADHETHSNVPFDALQIVGCSSFHWIHEQYFNMSLVSFLTHYPTASLPDAQTLPFFLPQGSLPVSPNSQDHLLRWIKGDVWLGL